MSKSILSINQLSIGYKDELIHSIDLEVKKGEIIAIIGPSGLGKTTLLRAIAGLITPISGSIIRNVAKRGGIGYIPQKLGLVRHASVYHNVDLGARAGTPLFDESGGFRDWAKRRSRFVNDAIKEMGLEEKTYQTISKLSGGQQRRVATARTLAQRPKLILGDEFLSELDNENVDNIIEIFKSYIEHSGAAMILVEHDIERAKRISNRVLMIRDFQLVKYDPEAVQ